MKRLKELRKQLNYSQKDVADLLFVNQTAVSQWERGATTPSYELLQRLADIFNVTTDYLLGRSDNPTPSGHEKDPSTDLNELEQYLLMRFRNAPIKVQESLITLLDNTSDAEIDEIQKNRDKS